jgi:hypothetical protein
VITSSISSPYVHLNITTFNGQVSLAVTLYSEVSDFDFLPGKCRYCPTLVMTGPKHYFLIRCRIFISATTFTTLPFPHKIPPKYFIQFFLISWNVTLYFINVTLMNEINFIVRGFLFFLGILVLKCHPFQFVPPYPIFPLSSFLPISLYPQGPNLKLLVSNCSCNVLTSW